MIIEDHVGFHVIAGVDDLPAKTCTTSEAESVAAAARPIGDTLLGSCGVTTPRS
jgi:hypothetical protein